MIVFEGEEHERVSVRGHTEHGLTAHDEFTTARMPPMAWHGELFAPGGDCLRVTALMIDDAWQFAAGPVGDGVPFPDWPIRITRGSAPYSARLEVDAPDGTRLDNVWPAWTLPRHT